MRRARHRRRSQNWDLKLALEILDIPEMTLVPGMGSGRPGINHINQTGMFQSQKSEVRRLIPKFALEDSADYTGLTDESSQTVKGARKLETAAVLETRSERGAQLKAAAVIPGTARTCARPVFKREPSVPKSTHYRSVSKKATAPRAAVRPVPGAIGHCREGQMSPIWCVKEVRADNARE
jgi:hypothetical protein